MSKNHSYLFICPFLLSLLAATTAAAQSGSLRSPNVSGNALFLWRQAQQGAARESTTRNGVDIQEAELAFYADVDPSSKLTMLFTAAPQYTLQPGGEVTQGWAFEPEELYSELTQIPNVAIKLGLFKSALGKANTLHTHAFPFIEAPLFQTVLVGDEGLSDVGASVAYLLPTPWFAELTAQFLRGEGENVEFHSSTPGDGVGVFRLKNLFDLNDDATIEAGVSAATGRNSLDARTNFIGGDLTLKWRPSEGGKYHSGILGVEYLRRQLGQPGVASEVGAGLAAWGQYQFAERWSGALRYDYVKISDSDVATNPNALANESSQRGSIALNFNYSEFSAYRLQYSRGTGPFAAGPLTASNSIQIQASFTIGAHPAHAY